MTNSITISLDEDNDIIVKKDKRNQIFIEFLDSNRVKQNINWKVKHDELIENWSLATYLKNKGIDKVEAFNFFLKLWNSLKISQLIKVSC